MNGCILLFGADMRQITSFVYHENPFLYGGLRMNQRCLDTGIINGELNRRFMAAMSFEDKVISVEDITTKASTAYSGLDLWGPG